MTQAEARFPSQSDEDRREAFNQHDHGFPYCNWLYRHRSIEEKRKVPKDVWAPYCDPVTNTMRTLVTAVLRRDWQKQRFDEENRPKPAPRPAPEPVKYYRMPWREWYHTRELQLPRPSAIYSGPDVHPDPELDEVAVPESLMVNRSEYLWNINQLMEEWKITTKGQFEEHRNTLIKHALRRMGKL